jgi:CBS domain-containing membrane protein
MAYEEIRGDFGVRNESPFPESTELRARHRPGAGARVAAIAGHLAGGGRRPARLGAGALSEQPPAPAAHEAPLLTVRDLMSRRVTTVGTATPIEELRELMRDHRIHHLPVLADDGTLLGLVSHRDLLACDRDARPGGGEPLVAARVMSSPAEVIAPDTDVRRAAEIMLDRRYGCLPVVEAGRLVGILTESDFVRRLSHRGR